MKYIKTLESFVNETYYNKEWNIKNIKKWLESYAQDNKMDLKVIHTDTKHGTMSRSKNKYTIYDLGKDFGIVIIESFAEGAPRLNDIEVVVGTKGSKLGSLVKSIKISDIAMEREFVSLVDKIIK